MPRASPQRVLLQRISGAHLCGAGCITVRVICFGHERLAQAQIRARGPSRQASRCRPLRISARRTQAVLWAAGGLRGVRRDGQARV